MTKASGPRIAIHYCTQCHWLLRAAWMAQELLSTFGTDLGEVSLQPGTGGVFVITYDGEVIWERKTDGGFPDVKQLKQRVRDHLDPDRDLGHLDRLPTDQGDQTPRLAGADMGDCPDAVAHVTRRPANREQAVDLLRNMTIVAPP